MAANGTATGTRRTTPTTKTRTDRAWSATKDAAGAVRREATAPRLAAAGVLALGAAAFAYLRDDGRRARAKEAGWKLVDAVTPKKDGESADRQANSPHLSAVA